MGPKDPYSSNNGSLHRRIHLPSRHRPKESARRSDAVSFLELDQGNLRRRAECCRLVSRRTCTNFGYDESVSVQILLERENIRTGVSKLEVSGKCGQGGDSRRRCRRSRCSICIQTGNDIVHDRRCLRSHQSCRRR